MYMCMYAYIATLNYQGKYILAICCNQSEILQVKTKVHMTVIFLSTNQLEKLS